jgi:hypothetical protein
MVGEESGVSGQYQLLTVDNTTYLMPVGESDVRRAVGIINSGDALILEKFNRTGVISADLFRGPIQIYGVNGSISSENVVGALNFMDIASMRGGEKSSLGDLMVLVMMYTLEAAKDNRQTMGESAIMKRKIAAEQVKFVYTESLRAAEEKRDAAKTDAICSFVGACVSFVCSLASLCLAVASLNTSVSAARASPSSSAAGGADMDTPTPNTKALEARAQFYGQVSSALNGLGNSLSSMIAKSGELAFSIEARFRADIANANAEALRSYLQALNSEVSASDSAYRDASQQINQALEIAKQALNALQALRDATIRNI